MSLRIINAELVRELLPMHECMEVMRPAMIAATASYDRDLQPLHPAEPGNDVPLRLDIGSRQGHPN